MTCLLAFKKTFIEAQIAAKEAELTAARAAALEAIPNSEVMEYEFDSGEGRQRVKRRAPSSNLAEISKLEAEIMHLYRQLNGYGLSMLKNRRYT